MNLYRKTAETFIGPILHIPYITRHQAGAYLCIASVSISVYIKNQHANYLINKIGDFISFADLCRFSFFSILILNAERNSSNKIKENQSGCKLYVMNLLMIHNQLLAFLLFIYL